MPIRICPASRGPTRTCWRPSSFTVSARKSALELSFPADWIEGHPLTHADLVEEASKLQGLGFELKVR